MDRTRRQHVLVLKIPPIVLVGFTATLMWLVSLAAPSFPLSIPAKNLCMGVLVSTGAIISGLGVASFRRAKTTVNPMKPESSCVLVDSGIYGLTRNPMYLGFCLGLLGWAVFLSNFFAFLLLPAFMLYMNRFQIEPEEKILAATFGQPFIDYKTKVRRWL
ncbi:MAG: isoprenylcysteine carboxylmethyltransferase family protein [Candidatus Omnitrophica bacterium]|nr:isoprenylcysteine carboxylmethyltransferase family protein [Candidatus Omnitrophota bacterium]